MLVSQGREVTQAFFKIDQRQINSGHGSRQEAYRKLFKGTTMLTRKSQAMEPRVEKAGPRSWFVFVNGQRHHETFITRAAARIEAKRQKETNKIDNES
jgi:hypothetical protein